MRARAEMELTNESNECWTKSLKLYKNSCPGVKVFSERGRGAEMPGRYLSSSMERVSAESLFSSLSSGVMLDLNLQPPPQSESFYSGA